MVLQVLARFRRSSGQQQAHMRAMSSRARFWRAEEVAAMMETVIRSKDGRMQIAAHLCISAHEASIGKTVTVEDRSERSLHALCASE